MSVFSRSFLIFVSWLFLTGVIVLVAFHFGIEFKTSKINKEQKRIEVRDFSKDLATLYDKSLNLHVQSDEKIIPPEVLKSWLESYIRNYSGKEDLRISPEKVGNYLATIAKSVDVEPVNARLILVNGRAQEFVASSPGQSLNKKKSKELIVSAIINNQLEVTLPVDLIEPLITTDKVNELGITTLIGHGESDFKGSSRARIHNIKIGAEKYNGIILKPDEEFSFNSLLGSVDEQSGFESELVIKSGKLVKEAGGGLCQVSTTLFRSAIMAGLPIIERAPHSFPVRYYNPQGFDSTIYPGVVDLKFKNDTSGYILIQSKIEGTKIIFDIYGSKQERKIVLDGPHQYDQRISGAMKAYFVRKIYSGDNLIKEEHFSSNYRPPAPLESNPLE